MRTSTLITWPAVVSTTPARVASRSSVVPTGRVPMVIRWSRCTRSRSPADRPASASDANTPGQAAPTTRRGGALGSATDGGGGPAGERDAGCGRRRAAGDQAADVTGRAVADLGQPTTSVRAKSRRPPGRSVEAGVGAVTGAARPRSGQVDVRVRHPVGGGVARSSLSSPRAPARGDDPPPAVAMRSSGFGTTRAGPTRWARRSARVEAPRGVSGDPRRSGSSRCGWRRPAPRRVSTTALRTGRAGARQARRRW